MTKLIGAAVLALTVVAVPEAAAQICAGFPTANGQGAAEVRAEPATTRRFAADTIPDARRYGARLAYDTNGPLGVFGGLDVLDFDEGVDSELMLTAGFALAADGPEMPVALCLVAGGSFAGIAGRTAVQVPVGFGVARSFPAGRSGAVTAYVIPGVLYQRISIGGDKFDDAELAISGGLLLELGGVYVGGTVESTAFEGTDPVIGVRAGIRIR